MEENKTFSQLSKQIELTHLAMQQSVSKAINQHLTSRNWLIGYYIKEYEQNGEERAKYGEKLLVSLSKQLKIKGLGRSMLEYCRLFYSSYPQLGNEIIQYVLSISQSAIGKFNLPTAIPRNLYQTTNNQVSTVENNYNDIAVSPAKLFSTLSFTHFVELVQLDDNLKRRFYEIECIKGCWSVRELQRQIGNLCFERAGYSERPDLLMVQTHAVAEKDSLKLMIKNPYNFHFLGISDKDIVTENELEVALMDHLQDFILELGYGFCFEARQKKILIDTEYYSIDLVFYHRVLHCHVLIELKTEKFKHKHISQLNTYIEYYKHNEMHEGDNDPVGILLVTEKGKALVEYAKGSMDNQLFVSKYILELPSKEKLANFLRSELNI
jgi:predicted nuclease of restriction endonuclease-like (RecB) superfamily